MSTFDNREVVYVKIHKIGTDMNGGVLDGHILKSQLEMVLNSFTKDEAKTKELIDAVEEHSVANDNNINDMTFELKA